MKRSKNCWFGSRKALVLSFGRRNYSASRPVRTIEPAQLQGFGDLLL
jgi:hypothetical protein